MEPHRDISDDGRVRAWWILGACLLGACDPWFLADMSSGVDAPTASDRCAAAQRDWAAAVGALDASCETADDCIVLGDNGSCEAEPALGGCMGIATNRLAYEAHREAITEIAAGFSGCTCEDVDCTVDCGGGYPACENGHCAAHQSDFCLSPPVDAGPDAL